MRKLVLAITLAAVAAPVAPVLADPPRHAKAWGHEKHAKKYRKQQRKSARNWERYRNYDYNRPDPRYGNYYADRYYREGNYRPYRLSSNDRIYRGSNGRYYCRRSDGTTGLIIGALGGGVLGNIIAPGESKTLGTILGAGAGGLLGRAIDRDDVNCR